MFLIVEVFTGILMVQEKVIEHVAYTIKSCTRKGDITKYTTLNYINADMEYLALGNSYTGTNWNTNFCGWISDFRMFTTVLSADDVKALYQNSASITSTGQVMLAGEVVES